MAFDVEWIESCVQIQDIQDKVTGETKDVHVT